MVNSKLIKKTGYSAVLAALLLVFAVTSAAAPKLGNKNKGKPKEEPEVVESKELTGVVTSLSESFIAIVYKEDRQENREYEIALPIDEDVKLVHKKKLSQIKEGDTVLIKYEETTKSYKNYRGERKRRSHRRAKVIKFLRPAEAKPVIREGE